jgi:DNA-binding IclR family transcriptional regulator
MDHEFIVDLDGVDQRRYAIGPAVLNLARAAFGQAELRRCAYRVMRVIAEKTGETVNLSVRQGSRAICIESIEAEAPLRFGGRLGSMYPLYAGSAKTILAFLEPTLREHLIAALELRPCTTRTVRTRAELVRRLAVIRRRGYEISRGEIVAGTKAVAAPIFEHTGWACAVLSVGAPESRITTRNQRVLVAAVVAGAHEISMGLRRERARE